MAQAPMFRINQLAKDLDIKTKDIITKLEEEGLGTKKTMTLLEPDEFNMFFDAFTKENQITDIDGYLHGAAGTGREDFRQSFRDLQLGHFPFRRNGSRGKDRG